MDPTTSDDSAEKIWHSAAVVSANAWRVIAVASFAAILAMATVQLPSETESLVGPFTLANAILGVWLGYRAQRLAIARPLRIGFGVAWRIGAWWALVVCAIGIMENEGSTLVPTEIMTMLPTIFWSTVLFFPWIFTLGHGVGVLWNNRNNFSLSFGEILSCLLGIVGIAISIYALVTR